MKYGSRISLLEYGGTQFRGGTLSDVTADVETDCRLYGAGVDTAFDGVETDVRTGSQYLSGPTTEIIRSPS